MSTASTYQQHRSMFYGAFLGLVVGVLLGTVQFLGGFEKLEYLFLTSIYQLKGEADLHPSIRTIGITSGKGMERSEYAQLIRLLKKASAKVIAFDIIFSKKEDPESIKGTEELAKAIKQAGNVILPVFEKFTPKNRFSNFQKNLSWPYLKPMVLERNDPLLTQTTTTIGHFNVSVVQGMVWSLPFGMIDSKKPGKKYLHMGLLGGLLLREEKNLPYQKILKKAEALFTNQELLDSQGRFYPTSARPQYLPYSAVINMSESEAKNEFRNKLVFIGQTAQGMKFADQWGSPFGTHFGVSFHASTAHSLLTNSFYRPKLKSLGFIFVSILTSTLLGFFTSRLSVLKSIVMGVSVLIAYLSLSFAMAKGTFFPPELWPTACFSVTVICNLLGIFVTRSGLTEGLLQRRQKEIEVLQAEDQESSERIDVRHVGRQIANTVLGEELKADWCVIRQQFKDQEDGDEVSIEGYGNWDVDVLKRLEETIANRVFESGESYLIPNVPKQFHDISNSLCPSAMAAPFKDGKEIIGTVVIGGKLGERLRGDIRYRPGDMHFFRALAREWSDRIVIARYNRTLEDRVQKRTLDLQMANHRLKELDRQKSDFMNMVAHDLRTPLTSIRSYAEIMLTYKDEPPETYEGFLTIINDESSRLNGLIDNFLDLARIESGSFRLDIEPTTLNKLVDHAVAVFKGHADPKNISLTSELPTDLPKILCDGDRIAQVLANLLSNALKFTPEDGSVRIVAELKNSEKREGETLVEIGVIDTGPGIPEDAKKQIFQKFGQVDTDDEELKKKQRAGTGLGLPLCQEFVENHHGQIWVNSEVGKGSAFYFSLYCEGSTIFDDDEIELTQAEKKEDPVKST